MQICGNNVLDNKEHKYEKFKVENVEHLIKLLKTLRLSREMIIFNIKKYGYEENQEYVLDSLGYKCKSKYKIVINESIKIQAEIFRELFDTERVCFVRIRNKYTGKYRCYPVSVLKNPRKLQGILNSKYFSNMKDIMYSLNTFNNMFKADEKSVFSLHTIALDVDYDKNEELADKDCEEVLELLSREYGKSIPKPNFIEFGNRIRLIYKIECVGATDKSLKVYHLVGQALANRIKEFGATVQAATTYGRILGSINTRNKSKIVIKRVQKDSYKLRALQDEFVERPEWYEAWKEKRARNNRLEKVILMNNEYKLSRDMELNKDRLRDLKKIQHIRQEGFREILCYLYRNYCLLSGMEKEEARDAMEKFNLGFDEPLLRSRIEQDTRALEKKQYLHKNSTILELLDITVEEEERLNLKTIISNTEHKRRDNEANKRRYRAKLKKQGKKTKKEEIDEIKKKIKKLKSDGQKNREIARELDRPIKTIERHITNMKKDGLL